MMSWIWSALAAFGSGALGAMGLGGGGILVIYLTLVVGMPQLQAQGVNLLFFLPCAVISLIINAKRKLIDWRNALWIALGGLPATLLGIWLSDLIDARWIGYIFAGLLIFIGVRELFSGVAKCSFFAKKESKKP